jgi:valyl-tRNA synthetase
MELTKNFEPKAIEDKWYKHWLSQRYFNSKPDGRPAFTVVIPPPNVTGVLHMGHTLNETVQDILVRKARMSGFNACWVPGSDHASIATEAKVVGMLKEKGLDKNTLLNGKINTVASSTTRLKGLAAVLIGTVPLLPWMIIITKP